MKSPFEFNDYRAFLKHRMNEHGKGLMTKLAEAGGCQLSYLSQALAGRVQLTRDHAFGIASELNLENNEFEYFMTLVEEDRAASKKYRDHLKEELRKQKTKYDQLKNKVAHAEIHETSTYETVYNSSWLWSAVHLLTSSKRYQTEDAIASKLSISPEMTRSILQFLEKMDFVERKGSLWLYKSGAGHLPKESPLHLFFNQNWKVKALENGQKPNQKNLSFCLAQTLSEEDFERIKQEIHQLISRVSKIAEPSKPLELMCFSLDLFLV